MAHNYNLTITLRFDFCFDVMQQMGEYQSQSTFNFELVSQEY